MFKILKMQYYLLLKRKKKNFETDFEIFWKIDPSSTINSFILKVFIFLFYYYDYFIICPSRCLPVGCD